jgi:hypothetical protein
MYISENSFSKQLHLVWSIYEHHLIDIAAENFVKSKNCINKLNCEIKETRIPKTFCWDLH